MAFEINDSLLTVWIILMLILKFYLILFLLS